MVFHQVDDERKRVHRYLRCVRLRLSVICALELGWIVDG